MEYRVEWHPETGPELQDLPRHSAAIKKKIDHIAKNIPVSLNLRGVQPTRGLPDGYEVDIAGTRAAIRLEHERTVLFVCFIGTEAYAYRHYLQRAQQRLPPRLPPPPPDPKE